MIAEIGVILLFYFLSILQDSFLAHFNFFGAVPNLVFIFFFLLVFFGSRKMGYKIVFYGMIAGLFLDIFSYSYLGFSAVLLIAIGFFAKRMQSSLKEGSDQYPFVYFLPLFLMWLMAYQVLAMLYLRFIDPSHVLISFNITFSFGLIYNLLLASMGFLIFKQCQKYTKSKIR